ncbi:MAG: MFS transporter [Myxococcales bacterium]|nr:MFS transporter [Myxococcales bacterium]
MSALPGWVQELLPIAMLLLVVALVIGRLPRVEGVEHTPEFRRRRVMNWLPIGLLYAMLYFGRYNLKVSQTAFGDILVDGVPMMTNQGFATIFLYGTLIYGGSFIFNGPLTDRIGGKKAILISGSGAAVMNALMGVCTWSALNDGPGAELIRTNLTAVFSVLYAVNMYFQSFGAVAIVKVNAPWFHLRERGIIGAIFGILISLGLYFAFDWSRLLLTFFRGQFRGVEIARVEMVFFAPAIMLALFWVIVFRNVQNTPGEAGFADFDTADATSTTVGEAQLGTVAIFKLMLKNPVIVTIAMVEFCSGYLRQAIMQWFGSFAKQTDSVLHLKNGFVNAHWGMLLCCAGILGGVIAGLISDRVFQSRRGPVASILYGGMVIGSVVLTFAYKTPLVGWIVVAMSMCVIGVHGMLSGTASMDFGGKKNVGVVVGIIDGFVYAGTALMSLVYGIILPNDTDKVAASNPDNWLAWPLGMIPVAVIGTLLALRIWNAKPQPKPPAAPAAAQAA